MEEFDAPSYDQDVVDGEGFPPGADEFRRRLEANVAFVIASLEYNFSMPGLQAATGACGRYAYPWSTSGPGCSPIRSHSPRRTRRLMPTGGANKQLSDWFERNIVAFMDLAEAAKHYPCAKKAWVEFLGEHPNAATARVE